MEVLSDPTYKWLLRFTKLLSFTIFRNDAQTRHRPQQV